MALTDATRTVTGDEVQYLLETLTNFLDVGPPPETGDWPTATGMDRAKLIKVETFITNEVLPRLRAALSGRAYVNPRMGFDADFNEDYSVTT